jgi:hypothetical protein
MFEAENIRDWRNHEVLDPSGAKIGQLEAIYVDTSTDRPSFASVRTGMIGRHRLRSYLWTGPPWPPRTCGWRTRESK